MRWTGRTESLELLENGTLEAHDRGVVLEEKPEIDTGMVDVERKKGKKQRRGERAEGRGPKN